ncbi:hypothetical protein COOONC_00630 [Cooperia oncophora]
MFGAFYRVCPKKPEPESKPKPEDDAEDDQLTPQTHDSKEKEAVPEKVLPPGVTEPSVAPPLPETKDEPVHTEATHFYSWLTSSDARAKRASDVLFRPKLA